MQFVELYWPVGLGSVFLLIAAWRQYRFGRVPNTLVAFFLAGSFVTAGCMMFDLLPQLQGGVASLVTGLVAGSIVLLPIYVCGGLGAGCVKSQAVFGAWLGCALPLHSCLATMLVATADAATLTILVSSACYYLKQAEERTFYLFPAQVTLSLGTLLALAGFWTFS